MDYSLPGPSVRGISQARILEWVAFSFSRDLPDPGMELMTPAWQANSLPLNDLGSPTEGEEERKILYFPLGVMWEPQKCNDHFVILTKKRPKELKNHQLRELTCAETVSHELLIKSKFSFVLNSS